VAATKAAKAKRAAKAAAAGELPEVPFVPSAPPADVWGICAGCQRERRTELGRIVDHRVWHTWRLEMVPCQGSGQAPATAAA
jgi:hypothetical protein